MLRARRDGRRIGRNLGRLAAAGALTAAFALTTPGSSAAAPANGWQRLDLWTAAPRARRRRRASRRCVRQPPTATAPRRPTLARRAVLSAPRVRARQRRRPSRGERLGRRPYVAFTPLADAPPCQRSPPSPSPGVSQSPAPPPHRALERPRRARHGQRPSRRRLGAGRPRSSCSYVRRTRNGSALRHAVGRPELASARAVGSAGVKRAHVLLVGADTLRADAGRGAARRAPPGPRRARRRERCVAELSTVTPQPQLAPPHRLRARHGVRDIARRCRGEVTLAGASPPPLRHYAVIARTLNPLRRPREGFAPWRPRGHLGGAPRRHRALDWLQLPRAKPFSLAAPLEPHTPHLPPAVRARPRPRRYG